MTFKKEEDDPLIELGLTTLQERVYLALVTVGESSASTVSAFSKVKKPDIYRILNELSNIGIVEKTISKPLRFRAISLEQSISILLEKRSRKTSELQARTRELLRKFSLDRERATVSAENFRFFEIPERGSIVKEVLAEGKLLKGETYDIVSSWPRFVRWIFRCREEIEETLRKGIRIRVVVDEPQEMPKSSLKILNALRNSRLFEVEYVSAEPPVKMDVISDKEAHIMLQPSPHKCGGFGPVLNSDHPVFVALARHYFETMWKAALENRSTLEHESQIKKNPPRPRKKQ